MKHLVLITFLLTSILAGAQESLQSYTPSILFGKGEWEFKSFQNVYTQNKRFGDKLTNTIDNPLRETYSVSINQFLYGINSKINVGADVWIKNVTQSDFDIEGVENRTRTDITAIGPKIKIAPFNKLSRLSIQSSLLFPLAEDLEGRNFDNDSELSGLFLEFDRTLWLNQVFYDLNLNSKWQLFFQQAFWYNFVRDSFVENNLFQTQTSVFASYFPNSRWTIYGMTEYFPTHYNFNEQTTSISEAFFLNSGIGTKFQLIPNKLELEALYTNFWAGSEGTGAGQTFNFGIRYIRQ